MIFSALYRISYYFFSLIDISLGDSWASINNFFMLFFGFMKYIFFGMLLIVGISRLVKLRTCEINEKKIHLITGIFCITLSTGILFNWFTLLLLFVIDPLPDGLIFLFIGFHDNVGSYSRIIVESNAAIYPYEQTIYYA